MTTRRRLTVLVALCAAAVAAVAWPGAFPARQAPLAQAAPAPDPEVTIDVPVTNGNCPGECIRGTITLSATARPFAGNPIVSVDLQRSPAGGASWTTIGTAGSPPYSVQFDTATVAAGSYDFRAVATDSTGARRASAIAADRVIANGATFIAFAEPPKWLVGVVSLRASTPAGGALPTQADLELSPAGAEQWTAVATADAGSDDFGNLGYFTFDLDTSGLADGPYDLRVVARGGSGERFVSRTRREHVIDTKPPASSVSVPGRTLSGDVTLTATADDPGGEVASVRFERSPAGADSWTAIGARSRPPYEQDLDTRLFDDGHYDLRVVAIDRAGNSAASSPVSDIAVSNPPSSRLDRLTIANIVAPARQIKLLGTDESGGRRETWAYGTTSAAPAVAGGQRLPYTAPGNQLVLLRHTDAGGWQIADVLRGADGSAFALAPNANVIGEMTRSGEAWLALSQNAAVAVFHRAPNADGGQFRLDQAATDGLRSLLGGGVGDATLALRQNAGGGVDGLLVAPRQPRHAMTVTPPGGGAGVSIMAQLDYGVLASGRWTKHTVAPLPPGYDPRPGELLTLQAADASGPGTGWGAVGAPESSRALPMMLGRFEGGSWTWVDTKLDALDSPSQPVKPSGLRADAGGVWIGAQVGSGKVVAYYDAARADTTRSWCADLPASAGCGTELDPSHPAAVPTQVFDTPQGKVAFALENNFVDVYAHGDWTRAPAPGFIGTIADPVFPAPADGWLAGTSALGRVTPDAVPDPLAEWPQANRSTLLSVAVAPDSPVGVSDEGALAVGLDGTALHYDASAGWLVDPTPARASRQALRSVAFAGPGRAFAVGQSGTILRWDGTSWSEDAQSTKVTQAELTSVAFGRGGEGWAVGRFGTILHFDGTSWSAEQLPAEDSGVSITSVAVAGSDVFAVVGGNLYRRDRSGSWARVGAAELPAGADAFAGDLSLVSALPDGGVVAAGSSILIVRQGSSGRFEYSEQPLEGTAVGLDAFRDGDAKVRAFISLAPGRVVGFPAGDGELLRQTSTGWQDLSRGQLPGSAAPGSDGLVKQDPVLAVASGPDGTRAWAVGGYAGTRTSALQGTDEILPARARGWRTAQIWRYDSGGSIRPRTLEQTSVSIAATSHTVSFAYFSNPQCRAQCSATQNAQPDVNLRSAAEQVAAFAGEPGGPAFAILGGNARGPIETAQYDGGRGALDFPRLPSLLSPLGQLPLFAAFGPRDAVPGRSQPAQPWADAFAQAPAPFGTRTPPDAITPAGQGSRVGAVHRYYAFDATQNGGRLRVVVLDDTGLTLDDSAPGQTAWLNDRLAEARATGLPVAVMIGRPLTGTGDDEALAGTLADAGVLAIFAAGDNNERAMVPPSAPAERQIPQYVGGNLGYQRTQNNGVVWYRVSVDTEARTVDVQGIPVIKTLALKPLLGLTAARSSTLAFEAVGRRPTATLATTVTDPTFPGFDNYVGIPAAGCGATCVKPSYTFSSSDPTIGDFVAPSGSGSRFPLLDARGNPVPSKTSGLFCAYNSGTTTVSVTVGLLKASLPVTVEPGGFGRPCGTVFRSGVNPLVVVRRESNSVARSTAAPPGAAVPPPTPVTASSQVVLPHVALPVAPPQPAPIPKPPPQPHHLQARPAVVPEPLPVPFAVPPLPVIAVPPLPAAAQPIPPGGSASAQAAARRKEKARKHASQSAFTVRPSGVRGDDWFFPAVGVSTLLALMLLAGTMRPGPRSRPRPATVRHGTPPPHPPSTKRSWS